MRTVILCGGKGTRAYPHTETLPKPLLEVNGHPILRQVMEIYAAQGHRSFVLAAGYLSERIAEFAKTVPDEWEVDVVDTGEETNTGERLRRCRDQVGERFFATYGDGLGNVDLADLLAFHEQHGADATLTTVPLPSQYGTIETDGEGQVQEFKEKPTLYGYWINAGFFVFDQRAFDRWEGEDLENEVLPALAHAGHLYSYQHRGFWASMDTYKDALRLTSLCADGSPPWMDLAAEPA